MRIGSKSGHEEDRGGIVSQPTPIEETTTAMANGGQRTHLYPEQYQVSRTHAEWPAREALCSPGTEDKKGDDSSETSLAERRGIGGRNPYSLHGYGQIHSPVWGFSMVQQPLKEKRRQKDSPLCTT